MGVAGISLREGGRRDDSRLAVVFETDYPAVRLGEGEGFPPLNKKDLFDRKGLLLFFPMHGKVWKRAYAAFQAMGCSVGFQL